MAEETKTGTNTSEFKMTSAGMFLTALLGLLAAFNVLTLTPEQKTSLYEFVAISWMVLPAAYTFARSHVKASVAKGEQQPQTIVQNKAVGTQEAQEQPKEKKGK